MIRNMLILTLASAAAAFAPSGGCPTLNRAAPRAACGLRMQASTPAVDMLTCARFAKLDNEGSIDVNELTMICKDVSAWRVSTATSSRWPSTCELARHDRIMARADLDDNVKLLLSNPKTRSLRVDMDRMGGE